MSIPESELSKWSDHGLQAAAIRTHEKIRNVLDNYTWPSGMTRDFGLQGSYSNDTNIQDGSDVDVVLQLTSTFYPDVSGLSEWNQQAVLSRFDDAEWGLDDFRHEVLKALRNGFREPAVAQGNKSIKIKGTSKRLPADVVVCEGYRKYTGPYNYIEGVNLYAVQSKRWIVNYPKLHYDNGVDKSRRTSDRFKRTVRMFKSARNELQSRGMIRANLAPSYFLECLLYNAPDWMFQLSHQQTFRSIIAWMAATALRNLNCQNGQMQLFGSLPEQWSLSKAERLRNALVSLWDDWD